ncbi:hypothetical protein [Vibrio gazogenes]|uniref:hypothetical protein n=1 Tax=Vibrio gazogenes TaxID=687 RepID=UPI0012FE0E3F|nr:hypothetical protein [Vibrio gazogenes]
MADYHRGLGSLRPSALWRRDQGLGLRWLQAGNIGAVLFISLEGNGFNADGLSTAIGSTDMTGFNPLVDIAF